MSETDVPCRIGHIVNHGVAHDVAVAVGQGFRVVWRESQLYEISELGSIDISVESQTQPFHARVEFLSFEFFVEIDVDHVLHSYPHGELVAFVFGLERDTVADLDVGHVHAYQSQLVGVVGIGESDIERVVFLSRRFWGPPPPKKQEKQKTKKKI